jgi:hypothetical protein
MLAWWHQRALGTTLLHEQFPLKCDCSVLQLLKPFSFEHLPDLLLVQIRAFRDQFTLFRIEREVELVLRKLEVGLHLF